MQFPFNKAAIFLVTLTVMSQLQVIEMIYFEITSSSCRRLWSDTSFAVCPD